MAALVAAMAGGIAILIATATLNWAPTGGLSIRTFDNYSDTARI